MSHPRSANVDRNASVAMMSKVGARWDRWICIFSSAWSNGISSASSLMPGYSPIFFTQNSSMGKRWLMYRTVGSAAPAIGAAPRQTGTILVAARKMRSSTLRRPPNRHARRVIVDPSPPAAQMSRRAARYHCDPLRRCQPRKCASGRSPTTAAPCTSQSHIVDGDWV